MRYSLELRLAKGLSVEQLAQSANLTASTVREIERGNPLASRDAWDALLRAGSAVGFQYTSPADPESQSILRRSPSYRAELLDRVPGALEIGRNLAGEGPRCFQCHFYRGVPPLDGEGPPLAWAPDLSTTRERLREDWVEEFLWNPASKYPGTAMPANFSRRREDVQYLDIYPDSTSEEQIEALMAWLFNSDQVLND